MAPQAAKDVANVVCRGNALFKRAVPVVEDAPDNLDAGVVEVSNGDVEAVLVCAGEMFPVGEGRGRAVKVGAYGFLILSREYFISVCRNVIDFYLFA